MSEIQEKKMYLIDGYDQIHFEFRMILEKDKIHFWLREDKIYTPFTFEQSFTYDQFVENHQIFKACDDLKEIHKHLINLYNKNRVGLVAAAESSVRLLTFKVGFISNQEVHTNDFTLELKMTENKDDDLLKLYKIQKDQIAALRKVFKLIKDAEMSKELPFYKAIMDEIAKCESKVDYE